MPSLNAFSQIEDFLLALALTQPRILAVLFSLPIFNRSILPGLLRMSVSVSLGLVVAPSLLPTLTAESLDPLSLVMIASKEVFIGFVLGCFIAVPFWAFEAVGFLVDNQRGASIASTINPLSGNDSSPLGLLFNQAFIVFFFISGGFFLMLGMLYDSFILWNVFSWTPHFYPESVPVLIRQVMQLVEFALLLAAPMVVAMFLVEMGLALVSRFVPQLQVFFLAMSIKSALALLVLILYLVTIFDHGYHLLEQTRQGLGILDDIWRAPKVEAR